MKISKARLEQLIREELKSLLPGVPFSQKLGSKHDFKSADSKGPQGRLAIPLGKTGGDVAAQTWIPASTQELLNVLEKKLNTSNFLDEILERIPIKQMHQILADISREHKFDVGGIKRIGKHQQKPKGSITRAKERDIERSRSKWLNP